MRVRRVVVALLFCAVVATLSLEPAISQELSRGAALIATELPNELSDQAFWQLINDFSEAGGDFPSDNFVSNEITFQDVIPELTSNTKSGGVYLGVGPDQNFTYIAAVEPKMAFIVDIRRQNMIQHLMYKALFELSTDRADFLSRLFSRPRPADVGANSTAEELFAAFENVESDQEMFQTTLIAIKKRLVEDHVFILTAGDEAKIDYIFAAFFSEGPNLTYNGPNKRFRGLQASPTYADMLTQTDRNGQNRSYIGSEQNFRFIQDLERKNLVVPLVGDFAGEKAIRSVAQYLREHNASVAAFYLSNVEEYLFRQGADWIKFYSNVETLPMDASSTLIRSYFSRIGIDRRRRGSNRAESVSLLCSIEELVQAFKTGEIRYYYNVIDMSK